MRWRRLTPGLYAFRWIPLVALLLMAACSQGVGRMGVTRGPQGQIEIAIARCPGELIQDIDLLAVPQGPTPGLNETIWRIVSDGQPTDRVLVGTTPRGYRAVTSLDRMPDPFEDLVALVLTTREERPPPVAFEPSNLGTGVVYFGNSRREDEDSWRASRPSGCGAGLVAYLAHRTWVLILWFWGVVLAIAAAVWLLGRAAGKERRRPALEGSTQSRADDAGAPFEEDGS